MVLRKNKLFVELFNRFLEINTDVEAIIVSDIEGLIIAGEKRKDIDMELDLVLSSIINPILERIRNELLFKKFGNASFDTEDNRILFISVDEERILSLVLDSMASLEKLSPYGLFLAEKTVQILNADEDDIVQVSVPNFEYEAENIQRLKNQLYQMELATHGEYRFKFVILGDHQVGKTSIIRRFVEKRFLEDYRSTIGLNVLTHTFEFFGNEISVTLYDLGAQEFFRRFRKVYYSGTQAAFIVFDLTNRDSFTNVLNWYEELKEFTVDEEIPIILVGNKSDLDIDRQVFYQEGVKLANKISKKEIIKLSYIETSALTGENIEDAFNLISYHYVMRSKEIEDERRSDLLFDKITSILKKKLVLTLSFFTESSIWSPGIQILSKVNKLGKRSMVRDYEDEQVYQYLNGLILKQHLYSAVDDISSSDGILCIFDARNEKLLYNEWQNVIGKMIENMKESGVILIGIQALESSSWSRIIEAIDFDDHLKNKEVDLFFFRIGDDFRVEIFDQLKSMLEAIDNKN